MQPEHSLKPFYCYVIRDKIYISVETTRIYAQRNGLATVFSKQITCGGMVRCRLFPTMRFPEAPTAPALTGCPAIDPPAKPRK